MESKIVQEAANGWKKLAVTFDVEIKARWWQFWKLKIKNQKLTAFFWVRGDITVYPIGIESTNAELTK